MDNVPQTSGHFKKLGDHYARIVIVQTAVLIGLNGQESVRFWRSDKGSQNVELVDDCSKP